MSDSDGFGAGACVSLVLCLIIFIPSMFACESAAKTKMWQEAERRGYAVKVEHSGGTGYKWKDE